jgi:hypothetical protein
MRRALIVLALTGCASPEPTPAPVTTRAWPVQEVSIVPAERAHAAERALALRLVGEARAFMGPAVAEGAALPDEVIAFRRLARALDADVIFERLIVEASPAGRCYALYGLRALAPERAGPLAAALLTDERPVARVGGARVRLRVLARELLATDDDGLLGSGTRWREGGPFDAADEADVEAALARLDLAARAARDEQAPRAPQGEFEVDPLGWLSALEEPLAEVVGFGPAVVPGLEARLAGPDMTVRLAALRALEELGPWSEVGAGRAVLAAVEDPDPVVRSGALGVLGRRRDPTARAALLRALGRASEEPELLRLALDWLLVRPEPGPDLVASVAPLHSHTERGVQERALLLLRKAGPLAAPARPTLAAQALGEDPGANDAALVLSRLDPRDAGLALAELLVARREGARQEAAARFLLQVPADGVRAATASVLDRVAPEQARALAAAGDARAAVLAETARAPSGAARLVAVVALAHEPAGLEPLEALAAGSDRGLAKLALDALRWQGGRALPALSRLLDEGRLGGFLRDLLRSDDPAARAAALAWDVAPRSLAARAATAGLADWIGEERGADEWRAAVELLVRREERPTLALYAACAPLEDVRARAAGR